MDGDGDGDSSDRWAFADRVVCISLRDSEAAAERRRKMVEWARARGDGLADRLEFFLAERHPESGAAGCLDSHRRISRQALKDGVRTLVVFEDDAVPAAKRSKGRRAEQEAEALREVARFAGDPDASPLHTRPSVVLLGYMAFWLSSHLGAVPGFRRLRTGKNLWCTHAMVLGRPGMRVVSELEYEGVDIDRMLTVENRVVCFAVYPMLFHQADAGTDVTGLNVLVQRHLGGMGAFMDATALASEWGTLWIVLAVLFVVALAVAVAAAVLAGTSSGPV